MFVLEDSGGDMLTRNSTISVLLMTAALLTLGTGTALAQPRIGFVNTIALMKAAPQAKSALKALRAEFGPREKHLAALSDDLRRLEAKSQRDRTVMSKSAATALDHQITQKRIGLRRLQGKFRADLNARRNAEFVKVRKALYDAVRRVAKKDGYGLVVSQGVVYANKQFDITKQVLAILEKEDQATAHQSAN